jgi:dipeptidyl aminopeptidase/acylaminoacyl peptidase
VFIIRELPQLESDLAKAEGSFEWKGTPDQITKFTQDALAGKTLRPPEDFYFEGAEGKRVHGFVVKPYGWKAGDTKKWPGLLFIHGGTSLLTYSVDHLEGHSRSPGCLG